MISEFRWVRIKRKSGSILLDNQHYHYLTYLLEKLPDDRMSDDELELLVPWNETVKAEIERRANESNQSYVNCQGAPATEK